MRGGRVRRREPSHGTADADFSRSPSPFRLAARFACRASSPLPAGEGSQQPQHPRPFADRIVDAPGLGQRDVVGEPDHRPAQRLDPGLAQVIPKHDVITIMHPAVDLDDQTQRHTGEIDDPGADFMLTPDLDPIDGAAPQTRPYPLPGEARGPAKIAGVFLLPLREKVARRAG